MNVGEFGGSPMPGQVRHGRVIPSQAEVVMTFGVCNEHVPTPEGKICSELHRNMQRLAETTNPDGVFI